jgi:hypothetical protein
MKKTTEENIWQTKLLVLRALLLSLTDNGAPHLQRSKSTPLRAFPQRIHCNSLKEGHGNHTLYCLSRQVSECWLEVVGSGCDSNIRALEVELGAFDVVDGGAVVTEVWHGGDGDVVLLHARRDT